MRGRGGGGGRGTFAGGVKGPPMGAPRGLGTRGAAAVESGVCKKARVAIVVVRYERMVVVAAVSGGIKPWCQNG